MLMQMMMMPLQLLVEDYDDVISDLMLNIMMLLYPHAKDVDDITLASC
jgi:hypothetical protein